MVLGMLCTRGRRWRFLSLLSAVLGAFLYQAFPGLLLCTAGHLRNEGRGDVVPVHRACALMALWGDRRGAGWGCGGAEDAVALGRQAAGAFWGVPLSWGQAQFPGLCVAGNPVLYVTVFRFSSEPAFYSVSEVCMAQRVPTSCVWFPLSH